MSRHYSANALPTTLAAGINDSTTSIQVAATTGFPAVDFIIAVDYGASEQEVMLVSNVSGTTLTVERGYDNTSAQAHSIGAVVRCVHSAVDFRDSRTHEDASSGVHGVSGSVVGTSDTQALTNKNLSSGTNTFPASLLTASGSATLTNKDLSSGTNTFPSSLATDAEVTSAVSSAVSTHAALTATHGATGAVVGTTNSQTLTNKTVALGSNTVSGTIAQFNTAVTDADLATLAGSETLTNKTIAAPTVSGTLAGADATFSGAVTVTGDVTAANIPAHIKIGTASLTFDANGVATLTHNAGFTPSYFGINHHIATGGPIISLAVRASSLTTTQAVIEARKDDGTNYASASLNTLRWIAVA